jgi:hypothetical protein
VGDFVEKGVEDVGLGVPVGVEGVQGNDPPLRAARAEPVAVVVEFERPAQQVTSVQFEKLTSDGNESASVRAPLL